MFLQSPAALVMIGAVANVAQADLVIVNAAADNTLYQTSDGSRSNGSGAAMFAGLNAASSIRRALVRFDVAASLPAGSVIVGATLRLVNSATNIDPRQVGVHRVLESWGEGTSNAGEVSGGSGVAATAGDATWVHRVWPEQSWSVAGGVFEMSGSASALVSGPGAYEWTGADLLADVHAWLAQPESNFGWLLRGDESQASSAKRFATREEIDSARRPQLVLEVVPAPGLGAWVVGSLVATLPRRRRA